MIKHLVSDSGLTAMATWGLVIFFAVFTSVALWTLTRSRRTVAHWSRMPLEDETPGGAPQPNPASAVSGATDD